MDVVIGLDVGTGSARAGVFDLAGHRLGSAARDIRLWQPAPGFAQQSSTDIWNSVVAATRAALDQARTQAGTEPQVRGIGVDATCSLVVVDAAGQPVSVDPDGAPEQDVVVWMDHRALAEAREINTTDAPVLRYVGGAVSLEMQTPKLLWLRRHLPRTWDRAAHFFDLPDWLTWRATGAASRSLCSTVCKWTYLGHEGRWDEAFFRAIGLGELADEAFRRIGTTILPMAAPVGSGLQPRAARELGIAAGTPVGTSAIDAHAGGIGTIGAAIAGQDGDVARRLALICGTSSCHMTLSATPRFVPGVWGPYFSAMLPDWWLNEGGQSATGALIDHVLLSHAQGAALRAAGSDPYRAMADSLDRQAAGLAHPALLTAGLHVEPDFHGNRSPRADATLRGMISGLSLDAGVDALARLYLATIQSTAYGTRHIIEVMGEAGQALDLIVACGGLTKNPIFLREHADAIGLPIALPEEPEAVLLGAAVLGAVAGAAYPDIPAAMAAMTRARIAVTPAGGAVRRYHDAKYAVFRRMHDDQMAYRATMDDVAAA